MGIIWSRFQKKKTAVETLEKLENDIKMIEESRSYAQMKHRKITKLITFYSLGLYVLFGIFFYFHFTTTLKGKLLYLVPLLLSPLVIYFLNKIISWYYVRLINKNQYRLNEMKKEKKRILDEVMDKETYKVAKEILEKFSCENVPKLNPQVQALVMSDDNLRKRGPSSTFNSSADPSRNPDYFKNIQKNFPIMPKPTPPVIPTANSAQTLPKNVPGIKTVPPSMTLLAPVLPAERNYLDKVFDYLIGDGPNNRYALICSKCHSHNGMALKEEFEYIGYKCCYCFFYNPARKLRPEAPKLEASSKVNHDSDSEDSDSKLSHDESEEEIKAELKVNEVLDKTFAGGNGKNTSESLGGKFSRKNSETDTKRRTPSKTTTRSLLDIPIKEIMKAPNKLEEFNSNTPSDESTESYQGFDENIQRS